LYEPIDLMKCVHPVFASKTLASFFFVERTYIVLELRTFVLKIRVCTFWY